MALPEGWEETSGEWRVRLKDPARFVRIRPKTLAGVKGVYMVGGPIKGQGSSWVPQAIRFKKTDWPSLTAAVGWYEASHFPLHRENPPVNEQTVVGIRLQSRNRRHVSLMWSDGKITRTKIADAVELVGTSRMQDALDHPAKWIVIGQLRDNPGIVDAIRAGDRVTIVNRFGQKQTGRAVMRSSHGGWVLNLGGAHGTPGLADESNIVKVSPAKQRKNPRGKYRILTVPEQHQLRIAKDTLRMSDAGARIMGGMTKGEARAMIRRFLGAKALDFFDHAKPRENPARGRGPYRIHVGYTPSGRDRYRYFATLEDATAAAERVFQATGVVVSVTTTPGKPIPRGAWIESSTPEELAADPGSPYRMVTTGGQRFGLSVLDGIRAQKEGLEYRGRGKAPDTLENPPRLRRGQLRLGAFRAGAEQAVEALSKTETELGAATAQAFELAERGEKVPAWLRDRVRGLELERKSQLEELRTAIGRHAAVLEELTPATRATRKNPAGDSRKAAAALYREFHGVAPQSFHFEKIPDLSQLLHLGNALRVDYRAARARGAANTPYRHEFSRGSELFTDRTGRALVILGNLKVSRAPRGRFGYIRAGSEG